MNVSWQHVALALCSTGAAVAEALAHATLAGVSMPWHITAGACLCAASVFGAISKSMLGAPSSVAAPPEK